MKHAWSRGEAWGKTSAALVGGGFIAMAFLICSGSVPARLGEDPGLGAALGVCLSVPLWTAAAWVALLAKSGRRAWGAVGSAAIVVGCVAAAALLL